MASFDEVKKRILAQVDLVRLIGQSVNLSERSGRKVGLCPFHDEKSGSFTVYPDHYYCFGCKENGDAITFVRKIQGLDFIDALKFLAASHGVDAPELNQEMHYKKERNEEAGLFKIMLSAQAIFTKNLGDERTKNAYTYLISRGFSQENIKAFGFGLALDEPQGIFNQLRRQGFKDKDIESCSLVSPSTKNGQLYDFYRNRITIPIHDNHGRLIAFGGRALDDFGPKYKNSRDSRLFDKSSTLFGLHKAKEALRKGAPAIVVEGYMDVLQLWQNEFFGAIACMGTTLKSQHMRSLTNLTKKVILLFDGDFAGEKASLSTVSLALEFPEVSMKVAILPKEHDPDSYLRANGATKLQEVLDKATDLLDFAIASKLQTAQANHLGIPELLRKEILPWVSKITDRLKQSYILGKLADHTGIIRSDLEAELRTIKRTAQSGASAKPSQRGPDEKTMAKAAAEAAKTRKRLTPLERELLGHLYFATPDDGLDLARMAHFIKQELDLDELWREVAEEILSSLGKNQAPEAADKNGWRTATDPLILKFFSYLEGIRGAFSSSERKRQIEKIIREHVLGKRRNSISQLKQRLVMASPDETIEILKSISILNAEINTLEVSLK